MFYYDGLRDNLSVILRDLVRLVQYYLLHDIIKDGRTTTPPPPPATNTIHLMALESLQLQCTCVYRSV